MDVALAVRLLRAHANRAGRSPDERADDWPLRVGDGSALGAESATSAVAQYVESFAAELRAELPRNLAAPVDGVEDWREQFAAQAIERRTSLFATPTRAGKSPAGKTKASRSKPYDEMAAAFPPLTRLLAPLLLGQALARGECRLDALELASLHRKVPSTNLGHAHAGAKGCGSTLNALALVAHVQVAGEPRCIVLGSLPLPFRMTLLRSVPLATERLLADLHVASALLRDVGVSRALLDSPAIAGVLYAGGPWRRGARCATDAELVPGRMPGMLKAVYRPLDAQVRPCLALAIPTHRAGEGPSRVAPGTLVASSGAWPRSSEGLVAALASAGAGSHRRSAEPGAETSAASWRSLPAQLEWGGRTVSVRLLARHAHRERSTTVWTTLDAPLQTTAHAIDAVMSARSYAHSPQRQRALVGSAYDLWINRAYRRNACGELLLRGGAGERLRAGVSGVMNAGFAVFALRAPPL